MSQKDKKKKSGFLHGLDQITRSVPLLGKTGIRFRLAVLLALLAALIIVILVWSLLPGMEEKLTRESWCVSEIIWQGKKLKPYRERIQLHEDEYCGNTLSFDNEGLVYLPGINEHRVVARWKWKRRRLILTAPPPEQFSRQNTKEIKAFYQGSYRVKLKGKELHLESGQMKLDARGFEELWERGSGK